ncbi:MAG: hypothetical protein ACRDK7_04750 [Solirubrobacteraceae bacterium]
MRRGLVVAVVVFGALVGVCSSAAAAPVPWWHVGSGARPSVLPAASGGTPGRGEVVVTAENVGDKGTAGAVTVADVLPAGLRATGIAGVQPVRGGAFGATTPLVCSLEHLSCETGALAELAPFDQVEVKVAVEVLPGAQSGEANTVRVSGGGARSASVSRPIVAGQGTPFGVEDYELSAEGEGGSAVTQAGAHPFQITGTIALDQGPDTAGSLSEPAQVTAVGPVRDLVDQLPTGLVADPGVVSRCLSWQFEASGESGGEQDECPYQSVVGAVSVTFARPGGGGVVTLAVPVFDLEPEAGEPARFGFWVPLVKEPVVLTTSVRSGPGEDWGVDLSTSDVPQDAGLISARVTFWGAPESFSHDEARGWGCLAETRGRPDVYEGCVHVEASDPLALVTLPTSCTGPLQSSLRADSWDTPGESQTLDAREALPGLTGCAQVAFTPTISITPSTRSASSPSGLNLGLNFDTEGLTSSAGVAQSDLQKTVVALPEGLTIDPSAGVGLGACSEAQYAEVTVSGSACPEDSKLGTVTIETPLLFTSVEGSLYLAQPYVNPFKSLIALYVVVRSRAERGILVKLAGNVTANTSTGQLTVTFEGDPQLPFEHFTFHFREGAQAPLITPATCGTYIAQALLSPFSEPSSQFDAPGSFQITSGSQGSPCPAGSLPPFSPQIAAGTLSARAGTYSPLYVELSRSDAMSEISTFSTTLPVGLTANLSGVPFCPEADIELARHKTGVQEQVEPSCPAASLIGHTLVGTGVGTVLDYVPGRLYLSGPFRGDPLSVVSVTSATIGPFDLGTIVIHFGLRIDPHTAQVSIDPAAGVAGPGSQSSEPIPTIIDGIVTHVRDIKVSIDRANFTLNPTSCASLPISSALQSSLAQSASTSTMLQASGCGELAFKPKFAVSTRGHTSKADGAGLQVKLAIKGRLGSEANIKLVKVDLPRQLPSRLSTLQQACTDAQFEANPAGCPAASKIGYATAITPILPVPLTGPAIFGFSSPSGGELTVRERDLNV